MLIKLRCKFCFAKVSADEELIGKAVNCPSCRVRFTLPKPQFGFGQVLGGYEIEQWLGSGAVGEVYLARQLSMNRPVALKVIRHDVSIDEEVVERFAYEARLLASLNHPSIVPVFDAGHTGQCHYMAMGYVDGETFEDRLKRYGRIDEISVLDLAGKVAEALQYAWEEVNLLHRDIKPANMMIDSMGEVKIMDMGIAKSTTADAALTQVGLVVGTPFYMSPEQAQSSAEIDFRSDLYALSASMYHMLTGTLPFKGPNIMAIMAKKVNTPLVPVKKINPAVSRETSDIISQLLNYQASDRLSSFEDFYKMLDFARKAAKDIAKNPLSQQPNINSKLKINSSGHGHKSGPATNMSRQEPKEKLKGTALIFALLGLCVVLGISVALIGDDEPGYKSPEEQPVQVILQPSQDIFPVHKDKNTNDSGKLTINPGGESSEENPDDELTTNIGDELTTNVGEDSSKTSAKIVHWRASAAGAQRNKLNEEGNVSFDYMGRMEIRRGLFTLADRVVDELNRVEAVDTFSFGITFFPKNKLGKNSTIMSWGADETTTNLAIIQKDDKIFLVIPAFENTSKTKEEILIGTVENSYTNVFVTYDGEILKVYFNGRLSVDENRFKIDANIWQERVISFGAYKNAPHCFWRGHIYEFMIHKRYLYKPFISNYLKRLSRQGDLR